ncbi:hypothetical protein JL720_9924 [Aureococcus anophagefferens]|nr:hypothetical protein JL720_9924 [Aureococcus anophagefferens]
MVKHNNEVPNQHFHKKWASSRGPLKVITWFDQPAKKQIRRQKRAAKAAAVAPRPVARLRPVVHCPTQKHCAKAAAAPVEFVAVTEEMNNFKAYYPRGPQGEAPPASAKGQKAAAEGKAARAARRRAAGGGAAR